MKKAIFIPVIMIILFSSFAASVGIFSGSGPGSREFTTVHDEKVMLYGKGVYKNMSADVAPQGIAQDFITLFIGVPLLLIALLLSLKENLRWRILLTGVLGYFLVTYLFYLMMGMYNDLFLVYVVLLGSSFFAFTQLMLSFDLKEVKSSFNSKAPVKAAGGFLIFNAVAIALLWLGIVVPPLLEDRVPLEVQHYTTLVVQGLDLGLLLPAAVISGVLLIRKKPSGYLFTTVYYVFLALLMFALTAKIIAMSSIGVNVIPAVFISPLFTFAAVTFSVLMLKNIKKGIS